MERKETNPFFLGERKNEASERCNWWKRRIWSGHAFEETRLLQRF